MNPIPPKNCRQLSVTSRPKRPALSFIIEASIVTSSPAIYKKSWNNLTTVGIWKPDGFNFGVVILRPFFEWSGFLMVSMIDIYAVTKWQPFCKKTFENRTILFDFQMGCHVLDTYDEGTPTCPVTSKTHHLQNYFRTLKCPVFKCFRNSNVW